MAKRLLAALLMLSTAAYANDAYVIGPPGAYTVQTPSTTKVERGDGWIKISWSNDPTPGPLPPGPGPKPEPPPIPPVPPAPVATGKLYVSLVYAMDGETQEQSAMRADLALSGEWATLNADFRAYGDKQKAIDDLNFRSSLGELPCLIVQELKPDNKAPIIKVVPALPSADAAFGAVKDLRGVK